MSYQPTFNPGKFRSLVLYLAHRSLEGTRHFGATKLNKQLYFCDFTAFARLGKPITGAQYQRLGQGPAPRELVSERQRLLDDGLAELKFERVFRYTQERLVPRDDCDHLAEEFEPDELEVIEEVIEETRDLTAREVSDLSHQEPGWLLTEPGETIPYESAWLASPTDPEVMAIVDALGMENSSRHVK